MAVATPESPPTDRLSTTLSALSSPVRRAILAKLAEGEATVLELAKPFEISLPAISRHLKVLEQAGLITRGREAQWRPCRLDPRPLRDVSAWAERFRAKWELAYSRLDSYLEELQQAQKESTDGD